MGTRDDMPADNKKDNAAWEDLKKNVRAAGAASERPAAGTNSASDAKRTYVQGQQKGSAGQSRGNDPAAKKRPAESAGQEKKSPGGKSAGSAVQKKKGQGGKPAGTSGSRNGSGGKQRSGEQQKSARPQRINSEEAARRRKEAERRNRMKERSRLTKEMQTQRIMSIAMGVAVILLIVLVIVFIRGCAARKNTTGTDQNTGTAAKADAASAETADVLEAEPTQTPTPTPEPYADKPDIDINSWEYILANATHSIEDYAPEVEGFEDVMLDYRIIEPMSAFVNAARNAGVSVYMSSGYRDYYEQQWLYEMKVDEYGDEAVAATIVAPPGTSEHQTGLAADITDQYYETKNESLENTEMYKWMSAHCQEYGFIVRFPKGKEDITGIIYEPWHFRYVGVEAATYIMEHDLTLEEFVALYQ